MKKICFLPIMLVLCWMPMNGQVNRLRGDVDGDGVVSISDVSALIDYLITEDESGVSLENADVDGDGSISIADVSSLMDLLLGMQPEPGPQYETFTVNGVTFRMVAVEGGTFMMGGTPEQGSSSYSDEKPVHEVTLSGFAIGETEVTQALWTALMGWNPSKFRQSNGYPEDLQRPVEYVSWTDCQDFIARLNELTGRTFRLPTEAEWEYAARGGNKSRGYKYAGGDSIADVAWYYDNSRIPILDEYTGYYHDELVTHTVATKAPNELGLYDMSGNVLEWCYDWWGYYGSAAVVNPTGNIYPSKGRISRGGCFSTVADDCSVARRYSYDPWIKGASTGFRLALQMDE